MERHLLQENETDYTKYGLHNLDPLVHEWILRMYVCDCQHDFLHKPATDNWLVINPLHSVLK